nr:retinitis pigmentosa 1-like 1 protein [Misgurnus anguillicaudatus]
MGSHKRSFQCFDAILDDSSHKPSLSYGRRAEAAHLGSPDSNRTVLLEDCRCYLCADQQQATSMTSGAYMTPRYHVQTHPHAHQYVTRRPTRPEEASGQVDDHHYHHHRHSRRIVLVKNSDPTFRKTIVLHRRSLRSLGLFMDEVSELMQCHIRKLYTLEGRKVDCVQSLLQCAGILVCVGREPFHPLLLDSFRKNSNDKLPKLNLKSRSSVCSDEKGAKKNVNFGLETKRSVIHPRCDSSNRTARLVMSSEKLFPNGLNSLPPGHTGTCPRVRETMMDDDIEKRVLVNKDGSLSMEMKVRFRLLHDETLQWSTEIKKSTNTLNESHILHDDACCLSHCSGESCSEVDSLSAGEVEETYNTKHDRRHYEEPHCQHCCAQCQEYDIWKNPIVPDQTAVRHIRSSSSSASSRRIVRKKASTDSLRTMSSEEYTEHVVEKATCIEQTFGQQGDTTVKHCTINCCCRQSQVCSTSTKTKSTGSTEEKIELSEKNQASENKKNKPDNSQDSQKEQLSVQITQPIAEDERPLSAVSSSSQILASLKEDQDEEDLDLLPSISRASHDGGQKEDEDSKDPESNSCCRSSVSMTNLSPRPPSKDSSLGLSKTCRKFTPTKIDVDENDQNVRTASENSFLSKTLSGPKNCKCSDSKYAENSTFMANDQPEESSEPKTDVHNAEIEDSTISAKHKTSTQSPSKSSTCSQNDTATETLNDEHKDIIEERSSSAVSIKSSTSGKSSKSNVAAALEQECTAVHDARAPSATSIKSQKSENSKSENVPDNQETEVRTLSAMSVKSNTSVKSKRSKILENECDELAKLQNDVEDRTVSAKSRKSNISAKSSQSKEPQSEETEEEQIQERALNVKSAMSEIEELINSEFKDQIKERASSAISFKSNTSDRSIELSELENNDQDRASSRVSYMSEKSKSDISDLVWEQEGELQERTASPKSATSVQSFKSTLSDDQSAMTVQPHDGEAKERAQTVMSTKSNASVKVDAPEAASEVDNILPGERSPSSLSSKSNISVTSKVSEGDQEQIKAKDKGYIQERALSALSAKSTTSSRSRKSETTPIAIERLGEVIMAQSPSAMSSKSNASLKSNKSKESSAAPEEHAGREETCKRASSAMSTKSEVSTDVEEQEQRASSAISAKSNVYATSDGSKMSEVAEDEHTKLQNQDDDKLSVASHSSETLDTSNECDTVEIEDRTPSALSTKSKTSVKSEKSKASAPKAVNIVAEEHRADLRPSSAMSSKSNVSAKSVKSVVSEMVVEEPEKEDQKEIRAQSALSAISNQSGISFVVTNEDDDAEDGALSATSCKSNASKRRKKSNNTKLETEKRAQSALSAKSSVSAKSSATDVEADDKEKGDRALSAMSGTSHISIKSSVSAKSKASKISEVSQREPDDTKCEEKAPSVISIKSSVSSRSNKSEHSELVHDDPDEDELHKDRPSSAISSISNISTKSISVISETTVDGEIKERALSAMSAKSSFSVRTSTSKVSEKMIDQPNEQNVERASSSRSLRSNVSGRSKKSNVPEASLGDAVNKDEDKEERARNRVQSIESVTSAKSKWSSISGITPDETDIFTGNEDVCPVKSSNVRITSNPSTKSKNSLFSEAEEADDRSTSALSSASKLSKADVEKKSNRSQSQLSVRSNISARSKKSKVSESDDHGKTPTNNLYKELNREKSPVSGNSKVSQSANSNKPVATDRSSSMVSSERGSDPEELPVSPRSTKSAKSKRSSGGNSFKRVLTPTSTSVSIGIVDECEADDVEKMDEGVVAANSRTSSSSKTEICSTSDKEYPVQMKNDRATQTQEERLEKFTLVKSNISDKSEVTSNVSSTTKNLKTSSGSYLSAKHSVRQSSPTQEIRSSSKASNVSIQSYRAMSAESPAITGQGAAESTDVSHTSQSTCSKRSSTQNFGKKSTGQEAHISPVSSALAVSNSKKSRKNDRNTADIINRPKSKSSHLQVNYHKTNVESTASIGDRHSRRSNKSCKSTQTNEEDMVRCRSATLSVSSGYRLSPSPPKSPKKSKKPAMLLVGSNDIPGKREESTDYLNTAVDGLLDTTGNIPNVSDNKNEKSCKCRKRVGSSSSCHKTNNDISDLSPSCLPNASPTEVVNEWLRKIPSDTALCDLGDEFHENFDAVEPLCTSHVPSGDENDHESLEKYDVSKLDQQNDVGGSDLVGEEEAIDKKSQENNSVHKDECQCIQPQAGNETKVLDSSVLVMKVLLNPKIDRCNSLPEVSPAYGHKLSTSAQGLLDCLAKLQLLDFGPGDENGKNAKYQELVSMLKSLWLCDPEESEIIFGTRKTVNHQPLDEEFKARSSSGVDVNSGSTSSGKSCVLDGAQAHANTECEVLDMLTRVQEVDEMVEEELSERQKSICDSATPDIASRVQWTPEIGAMGTVEEKLKEDVAGSDETIRNNDSPRELMETPLSSNKSSGKNPQNKETETDHQEDTSSGSPPAPQRPQLSKRVSQDPDPIWVLHLLNKLEKQFMTHYIKAMDEFKVRWNLDDSEQLDIMICELQDEVRRRIQSSIDKEIKKIQGRAGRPRPPKEAMSRESTVQTEQRRRRLKVMRNQSIDPQPANSEGDYTATGTDFSDQRSDDEYCPCDTCLKRKMASKPVLPEEMLNTAPVMIDFDLRRILQSKKSAPHNEKTDKIAIECNVSKIDYPEENVALDVVKEEDETGEADRENLDTKILHKEQNYLHASTARGIKKEVDTGESEISDGEKEEDASSTSEEYASEKESNTSKHLKRDMHEDVEVMSCTEVVEEIADISDNMMAENHNESEKEEKDDDEADSDVIAANDSLPGSKINDESDKGMENEKKKKAKKKASEEHTEEDGHTVDESEEEGKTSDDEISEKGHKAKVESVEDGETTSEKSIDVGKTAEEKAKKESETTDETEDAKMASNDTEECENEIEDEQTAEAEITKKSETAESKTSDEGETTDGETAEKDETAEDKTVDEGETAEDETEDEGETAENETSDEGETTDGETAEKGEIAEDKTVDEGETAEDETADEGETAEDETADEGETAEDKTVDEGETAENETSDGGETADGETADEGEKAENETSDEGETTDGETAEKGEIAEDKTVDEGETAEDETADEGETAEDKTVDKGKTAEGKIANEGEITEDDTTDGSETAEDETVDETAEDETADKGKTAEDKTPEVSETAKTSEEQTSDDDPVEEGETVDEDTSEDGQNPQGNARENETAEDKTVEDSETSDNEIADEEQTAEAEIVGDDETANNERTEKCDIAENETSEDEQIAKVGTAGEDEVTEDEPAESRQTAEDESAEEGQTSEDETANDDTQEDCETSVKASAKEENTEGESDTADDETAGAEQTAEDETVRESEITDDEKATDGQPAETESDKQSNRSDDETGRR